MESYEFDYYEDLGKYASYYRCHVREFGKWLRVNGSMERFLNDLETKDLFYIALDYSIPAIMVKYFKRLFDIQ